MAVSDQGIAIVIGRSQCRFHAGHGHSESGGAMLWDLGSQLGKDSMVM